MPAHYFKKFHPTFIGADEATRIAKEAGYDNWVLHLALEPGPACLDTLADNLADQHSPVGHGTQSVLLLRGHRGQPASVS